MERQKQLAEDLESWKNFYTYVKIKMFIASSNLSVPVDTEDGEKSINRLYGIALQQVAKLKMKTETQQLELLGLLEYTQKQVKNFQ